MTGRERGDYDRHNLAGDDAAQGAPAREVAQRFGDEATVIRQQQYLRAYGDRQVALAQQPGYKAFTNPDGSGLVRYDDGSSVKIDNWQNRRPTEFINTQGDKTTINYDGGSLTATSYKIVDKDGKVKEEGSKGPKDAEFEVKRFEDGKEVKEKDLHIVDIKLTPDGHLDFVGKDGLHHQRLRSGVQLRRDASNRILAETTSGQRTSEYTYEGNSGQPSLFTIKDAKGNIVEHGVKGEKGWTVYQPKPGEVSLDPKNLEDPAKVSNDPIDKITDVQLSQANGMRVEAHANGDRTWGTDKHEYRLNPSGSLVIMEKLADGKQRLVSFTDKDGIKTSYDYNDKGQVVGENRWYSPQYLREHIKDFVKDPEKNPNEVAKFLAQSANGLTRTMTKQSETDDWKTSDGKVKKAKAEVLADGSVQFTYPDEKAVITQGASGAQTVREIDKDGKAKLIHSTDTVGREHQFIYAKDGALAKMEISRVLRQPGQPPFRQTLVWEKTGQEDGNEVWETSNRKVKFVGSHSFQDDGSLVRNNVKTGVSTMFSIRGVTYDLPKPEEKKK